MKRLIYTATTLLVTLSFFAQYSLTATAPSHAESVSPDLFETIRRTTPLSGGGEGGALEAVPATVRVKVNPLDLVDPAEPIVSAGVTVRDGSRDYVSSFPQLISRDLTLRAVDQQGSFCDPNFVGGDMTFLQSFESNLDDLLNQIHNRFGISFITGPKVGRLPINLKTENVPWTTILRSQLAVLGINATCVDSKTIQLVKNDDISVLEKTEYEAAKLETRYIKLKYLQPSSSENRDIAGQSTSSGGGSGGGGQGGGCQQSGQGGQGGQGGAQSNIPQRCKFERLMNEVRQILGLNDQQNRVNEVVTGPNGTQQAVEIAPAWGGSRKPYVGQVPGRNMLVVRANKVQLAEIEELIRHADIPPFQVVIKGLVYTANEDRLKDIGIQTTITAATGDNRTSGGIFGQPVGVGGTLFDFSTLIGTVDFNVQANALQRNGVISIKSRPFATVLDGDTTDLTVGRQVPVIVQAVNNLGGAPGTLQILQAANLLSVTPHVIDDDQGNPTAVNLELQLESNDVDTSVLSQGVPSVSVRSIQSKFILTQEQTAILGGFTVDSDSKTISKTPGLGDIPVLGELFKRRVRSNQINRLYFAISVTVIPYGGAIEPVIVPGATTPPPSITEKMLERGKEPTPVVPPVKTGP